MTHKTEKKNKLMTQKHDVFRKRCKFFKAHYLNANITFFHNFFFFYALCPEKLPNRWIENYVLRGCIDF